MARAKSMDLSALLNTAVLGFVAFLVLKAFRGMETALAPAARAAGQAYFNLTHGPGVQVMGAVKLPDGRRILIKDIVAAGSTINGQGFFRWQSVTYQVAGRNSDGDYTAVRIIT